MRDRAHEPCGRTCLRSFISSLAFIERGRAVPPQDRLSSRASVLEAMEEWTLEVSGPGGSARKKANPFFILIIISLELVVMDETFPNYKRAFAWFKLLKTWASLGFGDTVSFSPPPTPSSRASSDWSAGSGRPRPPDRVSTSWCSSPSSPWSRPLLTMPGWRQDTNSGPWRPTSSATTSCRCHPVTFSRREECRRSTSTSPACPGLSLPSFPRSTR